MSLPFISRGRGNSMSDHLLDTAGIAQAVRLQEKLGNKVNFTIYERSNEIGGVWAHSLWRGAGYVPVL